MPDILFIKQRIRRGPAIESDIEDLVERTLAQTTDVILETYELGESIKLAEDRLAGRSPVDIQRARKAETERCLQHIRSNSSGNILLLNGYLVNHFNPEFFPTLHKTARRIATWQLDDPYYIDLTLAFIKYVDAVFTVDSVTIPVYDRYDKITEWLPLACAPAMHASHPNDDARYSSDVCFIGVPFRNSRRVQIIDAMAPVLAGYNTKIIGATGLDTWAQSLKNYHMIHDKVLDNFISTQDAVRYYNGAAINLNLHKDSYGHVWDRNAHRLVARSPCERTFSIAGCGAFQLIDSSRPDLASVFDPGRDIITFDDPADLAGKIDYYLENEAERREIALAGQERAYARHTYAQRIRRILEVAFT